SFSAVRAQSCADALVRDLASRKAIIPGRTLLVGHSMGGALATRVAADFSVGGAIAISPAPMHPSPSVASELLLFPTPPILAALGCIFGVLGLVILAPSFLREMAGSHSAARDSITVAPISFVRSAILLTIFSVLAIALLHLFIPFQFLHIFQGGYVASFLFFV